MKRIILTLSLLLIFLTGCSYSKQENSGVIQQNTPFKKNLEASLAENASEPIVGIWQIQREDNSWFHIAIIPNDDQENYQFKGVITSAGSLIKKGVKFGETLLYISKIKSSDTSNIFGGIWKGYYSNTKKWTPIKFEATESHGKIQESILSFSALKTFQSHLPSFFVPTTSSTIEKTTSISTIAYPKSTPGYGEISKLTGRRKTVHVNGYRRKNGTYVKPHYRSSPRRK